MTAASRLALIAAVIGGFAHAGPKAGDRVLVWPRAPDDDVATLDAAVRGAGFEPVGLQVKLAELAARATTDEAAALDAVQLAFAEARTAFLRQDFGGMASILERAETAALPVLARPRHAALLWELEFQRGLAELSRQDTAAARARFALALEIDDKRAPRREIYGPVVAGAFAEVADARATVPPRPVPLAITPRDARVVIDGAPVLDNARARVARPGLHVVAVAAPGYRTQTVVVSLASGARIDITLVALDPAQPALDRLGEAWVAGVLDPESDSGRRAVVAVARELQASTVVVVHGTKGDVTARAITEDVVHPVERAPTAAAAVTAALGRLIAGPPLPGKPASRSVLKSWWLWTGVAVVALAGVGGVVYARSDAGTIRVLPPE